MVGKGLGLLGTGLNLLTVALQSNNSVILPQSLLRRNQCQSSLSRARPP